MPQSTFVPDSVPARRFARPVLVRSVAIVVALLTAAIWRVYEPGYGPLFWVWAVAVVGYVATFEPAYVSEAPAPIGLWVLLGLLLVLATALRVSQVYDIPANISIDELMPSLESKRLADGLKPNLFGSVGWFTIPNLAFLPAALVMKISQLEPFHALRLSSSLTGLAGIAATFALTRRLLGGRAALAAAFFMTVGFWHLHNSRTGFPYTQSSFAPAMILLLILRAQQRYSDRGMALAGVLAGLALQLYFPVRILLLLCPLFLLATWRSRHLPFRAVLREATIFAVGAMIVLAPLLANMGPEMLTTHSSEILITRPSILQDLESRYRVNGFMAVLERNLWEASRMFTKSADVAVLNMSPAGLLDRGTLAMLLAGIVMAGLSGSPGPLLVVAWLAVTFVLGVSFSNAPRASYRLAAAMPAIYMLAGYAVDRVLAATEGPRAWYRVATRLAIVLALGGWVFADNYRLFFEDYARGDGKQAPWPEALRFMAAHCDGRHFYVLPKADNFGDADFVDPFCAAHSSTDTRDIPARIDPSKAATFLIMGQQWATLNALNRCYPNAPVVQHKNLDGVPLFTSVDVSIPELLDAPRHCQPMPTPAAPAPAPIEGKQRT